MRAPARSIISMVLNALPRSWAGRLVAAQSRLVPYLAPRDILVSFENSFYGRSRWWLSPAFRIERQLMYEHAYDRKSLLYFMRLIRPGQTCLDIGANIGSLTLSLAHRVGARGRVLAFEPGPPLVQRLRRNIGENDLGQVLVFPIGLGNAESELRWRLERGENCGNASLVARDSEPEAGDVLVPVVRLDDVEEVRGLERVDFIKIDVEGMELEVIQGALGTIARHRPILLYETLRQPPEIAAKIALLQQTVESLGYEFWEAQVPAGRTEEDGRELQFVRVGGPLPQNTLAIHRDRRDVLESSSGPGRVQAQPRYALQGDPR